jgi:hypothetical protein
MITIIHGNDISASREYFFNQRKNLEGSILLHDDDVNITHLSQIFEGGGLFESSKSIFIEQFLSKRAKSSEKDAILKYLQSQAKTHHIFLLEMKELQLSTLKQFKDSQIKAFKLPSSLFAFLDSLRPGNNHQSIFLFQQTLPATEIELVFFMLVRQFRLLLCLVENSSDNISEVNRLSPWQRSKLEKQAKLFGKDKLLDIYARLFEIEKAQKTGYLPSGLSSTIGFFLAKI